MAKAVAFKSGTDRRVWQAICLSTLLYVAIAALISGIAGWGVVGAVAIYAGFMALSAIYWVINQIVAWLVWSVLWRKAAIKELVVKFEEAKLPRPDLSYSFPDSYFAAIVDGEAPLEAKLSAFDHYLQINRSSGGIFAGMRLSAMYEEAISDYRATFKD